MDFLSTPMPANTGSVENFKKRKVSWNKGFDYWTDEMKANQSKVGRRVMSCPKQRKTKAEIMREVTTRPEAKEWKLRGSKNRKPVMTPYGKFPSALQAAKEIAPQLGVKPCTIQAYIMRDSVKYADWYYVE